MENFDSTKHFKVKSLYSTDSNTNGTLNLEDIVLVEIKDMNQTLINRIQLQISDTPNPIIIYKKENGFFVGLKSGNNIVDGTTSSSSSNTPIQINQKDRYYTLLPYIEFLANSKKFSLVTHIITDNMN